MPSSPDDFRGEKNRASVKINVPDIKRILHQILNKDNDDKVTVDIPFGIRKLSIFKRNLPQLQIKTAIKDDNNLSALVHSSVIFIIFLLFSICMNKNLGSISFFEGDITALKETLDGRKECITSLLQSNKETQESPNKQKNERNSATLKKHFETKIPHYMKACSTTCYEREKYRPKEVPCLDAKSRQLRRPKFISAKPYNPPDVFIDDFSISYATYRIQCLYCLGNF